MSSSNGRIEADIIRQIRSQVKKNENKLMMLNTLHSLKNFVATNFLCFAMTHPLYIIHERK